MIKLIYEGENAPTIDKEKYLWVWNGVYKYWNGIDWIVLPTSGGKLDPSLIPEDFIRRNELENLIAGLGIVSGEDGKTLYTWIKYADDANGSGMSDYSVVDGVYKKYIGLAYNKESAIESTLASDYQWVLIKGADGKNGADGAKGDPGKSIRTTVWEAGKNYYDGTVAASDGNIYLDIVTDKEIGTETGTDKVTYYTCISSHLSDNDTNNLNNTNLWEEIEDLGKPIKTPLVLADKIKADFIDVDDLYVKHLDGADGTFSGTLNAASGSFSGEITAESGKITGNLTLGTEGSIISSHGYDGAPWINTAINLSADSVSLETRNSSTAQQVFTHSMSADGIIARYSARDALREIKLKPTEIVKTFTTFDSSVVMQPVWSETITTIKISDDVAGTDDNTIYIVTSGSNKGIYVGSTKIV